MKSILITVAFVLLFASCKKENSNSTTAPQNKFVDTAIQFLKSHVSDKEFSLIDPAAYQIITLEHKNMGIKFFIKDKQNAFLVVHNEGQSFNGKWVTVKGISTKLSADHSGSILLESLDRKQSDQLTVEHNHVVEKIHKDDKGYAVTAFKNTSGARTSSYVLPEVIVVAYAPSYSFDYWNIFWFFDWGSTYDYAYVRNMEVIDYGGGGGGGGGGDYSYIPPAEIVTPNFISPDHPVDARKELQCFTNNGASSYTVKVNVNQPVPGTRDVFDPLAKFTVGHTYLTLQQQLPDGSSITRNLGFYPMNSVKPGSSNDQSIFGDDSDTPFDVALQISVSGNDFMIILNNLISQQSQPYDLDNFNCTNSIMQALQSINVNLPSTKSGSALFDGNNPGDLGEDIRSLDLNDFSAANGSRKVVRTVTNSNSLKPAPRNGGC